MTFPPTRGRPRNIKGSDSFYRGQEIIGGQSFPDWPLMEAVCLYGRVKHNVQSKLAGGDGRLYSYTSVLDDIERKYGRRFQHLDDALPFMAEIVENAKQAARDRAAQYRKVEQCKSM